jgi:hypothetical protein
VALGDKSKIGGEFLPFFKPEDFAGYVALLVEPKPGSHRVSKGKYGDTNNVDAKVTGFRTTEAAKEGKPTVTKEFTINQTVLARDLMAILKDAEESGDPAPAQILVVKKHKPKSGNECWVFRLPDDDIYDSVSDYYANREAEIQAAMDNAPDFD